MLLEIDNVTKIYPGGIVGVKDISLQIQEGMLGLLGPNGAGKTTLIRMIATLLVPTSGDIRVNGSSVSSSSQVIRETLGYLPQEFGVYPNLTAWEFLDYLAILDGIYDSQSRKRAVEHALEIVGLTSVAKRQLKTFSGGMKRRIGIAQTLLKTKQLLIVDEPTAGLDPEERIRFRNLLSEISGDRLVIFSTHIVADVETTCNDIIIMKKGRVLIRAKPLSLLTDLRGKVWETSISENEFKELKQKFALITVVRNAEGISCRILADEKPSIECISVSPTLEDAYVYHVGEVL